MSEETKLAANEGIKINSNYLRGTLEEGLADESTGAISKDDEQVIKFHGSYLQDDRDLRSERRKAKMEKAYSFMIRIRVPGGVATPQQWLETDRMAEDYANGTIKLTTRQAFQLHGVIKKNLKQTIKEINQTAMDTIAACGDVNRNVMCNPNPHLSEVHAQALKVAQDISDHLTPQTKAYHEIWLDGEKIETSEEEVEPIYGKTYLPRKFK
ncbi:MAG: sulfite reductase, partial [Akkermansiaceae bacterium]|nr:sulfite reductase [Akkermansiaceae bacterium]